MDHNFILSFIIGIIVGSLIFLPIFGYINKLAKKPIFTINVYGNQVPITGLTDLILWKITYPLANKIYNIDKLFEKSATSTGLEKLRLQFELTEVAYKKIPLIHMAVHLAITSIIFWVVYLVISKTLNNTSGYIIGSLIIFILNIINVVYTMKKKKRLLQLKPNSFM
jgi:hypothetical protein